MVLRLFALLRGLGGRKQVPETPPAPLAEGLDDSGEFEDLLADLGAESVEPDHAAELAQRDATIAELQTMLSRLQPLGEELGRAEKARLEAEARVRELEAELAASTEDRPRTVASLQRRLEEREAVLQREKERHRVTRDKLADRRRVAAARWHELRALRAEEARLRRELEARRDPCDAVRAPLPGSASPPKAVEAPGRRES